MIIPTAEPFFFPGNNIGCLLIHGFTGTPKEMRWLGEFLGNLGYTVFGIRLAGHATTPEDMRHTRWEDWASSVEDGYNVIKSIVDHVFVIGLSMGGILSLRFSAIHPVSGLVAMATPYQLPSDPRLPYIQILSRLQPWMNQGPADFHNTDAETDHICYPSFPTKSIIELRDLLSEMRACLPRVSVPSLLIYSRQDKSVLPDNAEKVLADLGSPEKELIWVNNSGHVIPREPDRFIVFNAINSFITTVIGTHTLK